MLEKTEKQFLDNFKNLLTGVIAEDEFLTIKTDIGNAVLISEAEWKIMVDALREVLQSV